MKRGLVVASWCMILFGIIHEITFIYSYLNTPAGDPVVQAMKGYPIAGTPTHLYSFYIGYALMMGLMLVAFGLVNLILVRAGAIQLFVSSALGPVNIVICLVALLLSTFYFSFAIPIVLTGLALALVTFAWMWGRRTAMMAPGNIRSTQ